MLNYMKSECYRVLHGKAVYLITLILTVLSMGVNLILFGFHRMDDGFPYAIAHFAYTILISNMNIFFYAALIIVSFLSADEYKNGALKNVVAGGISRVQIFLGKCVVYGMTALLSGTIVMAGFIVSAYALLEGESSFALEVLLKGTAANLPAAFASLILSVALYCIFEREIQAVIGWLIVMAGIPMVSFFLGLKIGLFSKIAAWMPWIYLRYGVRFGFSEHKIQALWMEPQGLAKCLIAGFIGMAVFLIVGILGFRKKNI